jgi:hypothetical protein
MTDSPLNQVWAIIKPNMQNMLMDVTHKYIDQCSLLLVDKGYSFQAILALRELMKNEVVKFVGVPLMKTGEIEIVRQEITIEQLRQLQIPTAQQLTVAAGVKSMIGSLSLITHIFGYNQICLL